MNSKARLLHYCHYFLLLGVTVAFGGLLPFPAFAASDIISTSQHIGGEIVSVPKLIAVISYVIGTGFAVRALFALKAFIEKADDAPINIFIGFAAISALLILLPYSLGLTANTLDTQTAKSILSTSSSFNAAPTCDTDSSLNKIFCNLVVEIGPFAKFLAVIAYVMAAALTLTGLLNLKAFGDDPSQMPLRSIIMKFVLATMLISLPLAMQVFVTAVTGVKTIETQTSVKKPSLFKGSIRN
jgi:type IV secretory pathway VirB2 component (pilin)